MIMLLTKGLPPSYTGANRSSVMRWKAVFPLVTPMGMTFHWRGPRGVLMVVHARDSFARSIW